MITVQIWRKPEGIIYRFRAEGHAGYAQRGQDIVCSAVAALTQAAVLGLMQVAGCHVDVQVDPEIGLLDCTVCPDNGKGSDGEEQSPTPDAAKSGASEGAAPAAQSAILETMLLGLRQIEADYGQFVRIKETTAQTA